MDPPGSKPIIQAIGGSTEMVDIPAVTSTITMDISPDEFAEKKEELIAVLALQYGVDPSQILLDSAETSRRRKLVAAFMRLDITIFSPPSPPPSPGSSVPTTSALEDLMAIVGAINSSALGSSFGTALGRPSLTVSAMGTPSTITVQQTRQFVCPAGKWCTAGLVVNCPSNTYNNKTGQDFATACLLCPPNSYTTLESSTSILDCLCRPGFYNVHNDSEVECATW